MNNDTNMLGRIQIDTVPLVMLSWLVVLLVAIWSIETLQQPNPVPYGPVRQLVGGATLTIVEPASRPE